jgi:Virulence-associated protein E-like domain/Bifunctional DNA primase/polymerase, N-terminal/Primase C terminal 2 (PriCT-2)
VSSDHNILLEAALNYAARNWHVFPLRPRSKKPLISRAEGGRGLLDATTDPRQIEAWWAACPDANIGIATGPSGLTVLDPDGPEGLAALQELACQHGPLPSTLVCRTANGAHLYYRGIGVRSTARGKLHVRGIGGYVVAPPSVHPSGWVYAWRDPRAPLGDEPGWVPPWRLTLGGKGGADDPQIFNGNLPTYLAGSGRHIYARTGEQWSTHEEARLRSALKRIPAKEYQTWIEVGMGLHSLAWDRPDGTSIAFDLWDEWSQSEPEKYALAVLEQHWNSFTRSGITIKTVFHLATEHGWKGEVEAPQNQVSVVHTNPLFRNDDNSGEVNGVEVALPAELRARAIVFPDVTTKGKPAGTRHNAMLAIQGLGIDCREDTFHEAFIVGGQSLGRLVGEISDKAIHHLRDLIRRVFGFEPGAQNVRDAAETLCVQNCFDPVIEYLDSLQWDKVRRLDAWLADYLGAPRDEWSAAVGRLMLVAAVRRAQVPGAKWDHIVVLEGPQGAGKSLVLETLAGEDNFSDMRILGRTEERQHEAVKGVWVYEIAELAGMRRAEVEHIKSFVTRKKESTRTAYAHYKTHDRRRCIFVATTNESHYLKDDTGNRRFLPVRTGRIDWAGVARDRDQLWAEAVEAERAYGALVLPAAGGLLQRASAEQEERLPVDGWHESIADWVARKAVIDTSITDVLTGEAVGLFRRDIDQIAMNRAARVLVRLGFRQYRARDGESRSWRYRRHGSGLLP